MKKILSFACAAVLFVMGCGKNGSPDGPEPVEPDGQELSVDPVVIDTPADGLDGLTVTIRTDALSWKIVRNDGLDWARANVTIGQKGTSSTTISVDANPGASRSGSMTVSAPGCSDVTILIRQEAMPEPEVPVYDDPDDWEDTVAAERTGMEADAQAVAADILAGINLGNTLEACDNKGTDDWTKWTGSETNWGNPVVTQTLIDGYKEAGFNAVRIPVAWMAGHISDFSTYKIDPAWLARVKEVVDYVYAAGDMYAIINIHWDGGWLEEHPTYAKQEEINAIQHRLWTQIAKYFRDYDGHLLFAGTNEVHFDYGEPKPENIEVQQSYNQTFVDAVRATGGRNAYRVLVTQAYNTNIGQADRYHVMSEDTVEGRQMLEVHCYTPWDFCGDNQSGRGWGSESDLQVLTNELTSLKKFREAGIPFVLGEYGALWNTRWSGQSEYLESRCRWVYHATRLAKENGYIPFLWDTGADLINRNNGKVLDRQQDYYKALMRGAKGEKYEP